MKFLVIGSGLIGLTTAYFLRRSGHEVIVIERESGPGQQTSFANGALLHPSMPEPWNSPGCWRALLSSLGRRDAALKLRLRALPALSQWGIGFLRNSSPARFERNTLSNLRLALHSLDVMQSLRQSIDLEYGRTDPGTLRIFRDRRDLERATATANRLTSEGLTFQRLSQQETVALEPALAPIADQLTGALHYCSDETGDAHRFCVGLARHARREGVEFRFGVEVTSLEVRSNRVVAAASDKDQFVVDGFIVAAGSYSTGLLRQIGVHLPVQPAKGYSITIDRDQNRQALSIPIVDNDLHAAIVPLGATIRVAGTAEFAGFDCSLDPNRIRNLLGLLRAVLPHARHNPATARPWCGLRPMSTDGVPIISSTSVLNLFVNTGHGHLGWTMAAGSARLLVDLMNGTPTSIDPAPYALKRFACKA